MKTKSLMVLALIALFIGMGSSAYATVTVTPIVSSDAAGTRVITTIPAGERFFVNVQVSDATGLAGAALTLTYNKDYFEVIQHVAGQATGTTVPAGEVNSSTSTDTILGSDAFMTVSDKTGAAIGIFRIGKVDTSTTPATVMLSGAAINGTTGTGPATGAKNIFRVLFRAKAAGSGTFALQDTVLTNTAAGWNGTAVPALVGALANTDANFSDTTKAFPAIAYSYGTAAPLTVAGTAGDINGDGVKNVYDVRHLLYYLYNKGGIYSTAPGNLDFNHDGKFDVYDVRYMLYNVYNKSGYTTLE